ncbi:DUF3011 domain-containing protein [Arenimonas donghaensis]|uniref:DUF3011 domain-containing protein n=1 Tax=Arenimonas donghaensis DSM 18148 = HO3-R19 TaxID=1121014 RepID=A0A087MML2_9GAMM|nr:DUF3011 domain-containing protein [Arenimonas donghaensis]KFL38115.1 hypothetical protein N788_02750 [Arenimonas donghaensis DSM 18148 = HO3-R19]
MNRLFISLLMAAVALPTLAQARDRHDRYDRYDHAPQVLRCESVKQRDRYCPADTRGGVRLVRQESRADCVLGRTWGYDRGGVWVTRGCRARFEIGGRGRPGWGPDPRPGYGYGRPQPRVLRCESHDNRPNFCRVPGGVREADIERRLSRAGCDYGYSWGFRRDGVWVDRGCRADFVVF